MLFTLFLPVGIFGLFAVLLVHFLRKASGRRLLKLLIPITSLKRIASFVYELRRKIFHLTGLLIPLIYYTGLTYKLLDRDTASLIMALLSVSYFTFEFLRLRIPAMNRFFIKSFGFMLREKEVLEMSGTVFYFVGCTLSLYFFTPAIAVASILMLNLGDMFAALVGRLIGRSKIPWAGGKSLEGSAAMFIVCSLIGLITLSQLSEGNANTPSFAWEYVSIMGAFAATVTELLPLGLDDNLTIPIAAGLAMKFAMQRADISFIQLPH